jgi:NAD(P)-dependent dehydrogenase (short-subunit alcohol dehydrogenase family)
METAVALAIDRFGGIDGLVNNAGASLMRGFDDLSDDDWCEELTLKFAGLLNPLRASLPMLRRSKNASVVNVSAMLAKEPNPLLIATGAARAGVLNLSKALSRHLASDGIRVNSVCLGLIATDQWRRRHSRSGTELSFEDWTAGIAADRAIPLGRFGRADEVAAMIVMLLSPRSSYVTGAALDVSGGVGHSTA